MLATIKFTCNFYQLSIWKMSANLVMFYNKILQQTSTSWAMSGLDLRAASNAPNLYFTWATNNIILCSCCHQLCQWGTSIVVQPLQSLTLLTFLIECYLEVIRFTFRHELFNRLLLSIAFRYFKMWHGCH